MDSADFIGSSIMKQISSISHDTVFGAWSRRSSVDEKAKRKKRSGEFLEHKHTVPELCQLLKGSCLLQLDKMALHLKPPEISIIPPLMLHSEGYYEEREDYRLAWWMFDEKRVNFHVMDYNSQNGYQLVHRIQLDPMPLEVQNRCHAITKIAQELTAPDIPDLKEALFTLTLYLYRESMHHEDLGSNYLHRAVVQKAIRYIQDHLQLPLSIGDVSDVIMLSPNYLTVLFQKVTGISLSQYIRQERIHYCKQLLTATDKTIKEIADDMGFPDQYALSHLFKRVTGEAPRQYRVRHLQNPHSEIHSVGVAFDSPAEKRRSLT
jgi:AraC-like DNA-binding protein